MVGSAPTFTPFLHLPTELQLKIWKLSLPPPRIIKIRIKVCPFGSSPTELSTKTLPSPLLTTCHRSRAVFLESQSASIVLDTGKGHRIYFNPRTDTVLLAPRDQFAAKAVFEQEEDHVRGLQGIMNLALSSRTMQQYTDAEARFNTLLSKLLGLEHLIVIADRETPIRYKPWPLWNGGMNSLEVDEQDFGEDFRFVGVEEGLSSTQGSSEGFIYDLCWHQREVERYERLLRNYGEERPGCKVPSVRRVCNVGVGRIWD